MRAKREARQVVQGLRRQGLSYREIMQRVQVSKSSASLWCRVVELEEAKKQALWHRQLAAAQQGLTRISELRKAGTLLRANSATPSDDPQEVERIRRLYCDERLGFREVAAQLAISPWRVYRLMRRHHIPRRHGTEQNYATYKTKPPFSPKPVLTREEEQLRIAGAMLYLGEGAKTGTTVDFANSDPRLISLFITFLRKICRISESRLRIHLYAYADQDIEQLKRVWSEVTTVPLQQFIKPYVRALTPNLSHRKMPLGLIHVCYSDGRLLQLIHQWGEEFYQSWAGT